MVIKIMVNTYNVPVIWKYIKYTYTRWQKHNIDLLEQGRLFLIMYSNKYLEQYSFT